MGDERTVLFCYWDRMLGDIVGVIRESRIMERSKHGCRSTCPGLSFLLGPSAPSTPIVVKRRSDSATFAAVEGTEKLLNPASHNITSTLSTRVMVVHLRAGRGTCGDSPPVKMKARREERETRANHHWAVCKPSSSPPPPDPRSSGHAPSTMQYPMQPPYLSSTPHSWSL